MLIDTLVEQVEAAKKAMQDQGGKAFDEYSQDLFQKHPLIQDFRWTQYTPAFNDGDPCEFSIGEVAMILTNGQVIGYWDDDDEEDEDNNPIVEVSEVEKKVLETVLSEFAKKVHALDDLLEDVFGNDVTVIVGRDGTNCEDYDCGY